MNMPLIANDIRQSKSGIVEAQRILQAVLPCHRCKESFLYQAMQHILSKFFVQA